MRTGVNQIITGTPERSAFRTISLRPIDRVYGPGDLAGLDYARDLADPGAFPYTRGIHESGYRGKLWTMRQFAGFGTPEETNGRYRHLLAAGGTGLSVAFDLPTLMGRDPDHPLSLGEVGKCGVSVVSLAASCPEPDTGRNSAPNSSLEPARRNTALICTALSG
jgi:methylmalonyl-CoA mutase N-terminal domain/subunit